MSFTERLRALPWLGSTTFGVIGRRFIPRTDVAVQRATGGRLSFSGAVGMPLLLLTTTGRRTGQPHTTPLTYARDGADLIVAGSNWGQAGHPAWALNLRAEPNAVLELHGRRRGVAARILEGPERAAAWELLLGVWPHFDTYAHRATARELLVFRLTER